MTATDPRAPLTIWIDARELQGRPTGVGRYLRSLLRVWTRKPGDRLVAYFNGPAPEDPVLNAPRVLTRPIGNGPVRGLVWQERLLPEAARAEDQRGKGLEASRRFDWDKTATLTIEFYRKVAGM